MKVEETERNQDKEADDSRVALGKRLRTCESLPTFGIKPNWEDYPVVVRQAIRAAGTVFYPGPVYELIFRSVGKRVFPQGYYSFIGNKIRQTDLFVLTGVSHPRTRVYYGRDILKRVTADFKYPMVAKIPMGSSQGRGVYLVRSEDELLDYLGAHNPAYIQEFLPIDRDLRVVVIGGMIAHAYWRIPSDGGFLNNVARGAVISFEGIPRKALDFAVDVAQRCRMDEVALDICLAGGSYYVLEANMSYGIEGFRQAGLDLRVIMAQFCRDGLLG